MIDLKALLTDSDSVATSCTARGATLDVGPIRALDIRRKLLQTEHDALRNRQNQASQEIARKKKAGEDAQTLLTEMSQCAERIKALLPEQQQVDAELDAQLLVIPNLLDSSTPHGRGSDDNPVIRTWGEPRQFDFSVRDHVDIGTELGILDFDRASKLAGARFALYRGWGARLERALINFMLDVQTKEHGYTEVMPPLLVNRATMTGTGQLPKFEADLFQTTDGFFLIPTAEVPLTNIYAGEIVNTADLPVRFVAYTPCFRSEAGSYGKDTRGLIRQHQFNKVELVSLVRPEDSAAELERMTTCAETILQRLELPYRVVQLCSADIGFAAARTYDLEVWLPSQNTYREISSCSNCTDFQARRAKIRFKDAEKKTRFVHTLNGSGLAVGRTFIAILENFQQSDGSLLIPSALRPYLEQHKTIKNC